jgi:hypothetical protein
MNYSMHLLLTLATLPSSSTQSGNDEELSSPADSPLSDVVAPALQRLLQLAEDFRQHPVSPLRTQQWEQQLQDELRELGRQVVQWTYNHIEPATVARLCQHVHFEGNSYTRLQHKTPQQAWTLFGPMRLWRVGYRPTDKGGDPTLFPLALGLGLVQGASPALAERAAQLVSDTGMTQQRTLLRLRQNYGVGWGVKKLRQVTTALARAMTEQRHEVQVERVLALLQQASAGTGRHKPVLSVGRDGITLGVRCKGGSVFEVATTGTVSVLDRQGRRLGTMYLAYTPEPGQGTMSQTLTRLLNAVLQRWQGPLPRLSYVTDAGDKETTYYNRVLSRMKHPRTGERLDWIRVVDYYHASERLWVLAELLFGKGQRSMSWVRKMQKWLLKPGGVNRVLHSAAAFRELYGLKGTKRAEFHKAYRYLRDRMRYLRYAEYRRLGVPLGSGVTEAGCKTVYTQRLKLSGMRWQKAGAQTILDLRVLQVSGVWEQAYTRALARGEEAKVGSQRSLYDFETEKAA